MSPTGIILASGSQGATKEAIQNVFEKNNLEVETPVAEPAAELVEPKREDFDNDEDFEKAQEEFDEAQADAEEEAEAERLKKEEEKDKRKNQQSRKPSRRQRAIDAATKPLRAEIDELKKKIGQGGDNKPAAAAKPEELKAPKREDFKTDEEFEEARFDYRYKVRRQKEQAEDQQRTAEQQQKALNERLEKNFETYKTSVAAFKEEHDDWDEVVGNPNLRISNDVYYAIADLGDQGPPVTYYLATHPKALSDLAEMTPFSRVMEVARLAMKLNKTAGAADTGNTGDENKPKPKRQLPAPVRPVSTAATSNTLTSKDAAQKRDYRGFKAAQRRGA